MQELAPDRKFILIPDHTYVIENVDLLIRDFCKIYDYQYYVYSLDLLKESLIIKQIIDENLKHILSNYFIELLIIPVSIPLNQNLHELFLNKVYNYATPSTGTDHVDFDFIRKNQIHFFDAGGENASSVVEYTLSALSYLVEYNKLKSEHFLLGIVGYGRIGGLLGKILKDLEINFCSYDPFVFPYSKEKDYDRLSECNLISFHVPLTVNNEYPTYEMVDIQFLKKLRNDVIIVNTSRGKIFSEESYSYAVKNFVSVMDVFYKEPPLQKMLISSNLKIATPHIAGYNWRSRFKGVMRILEKFLKNTNKNFILDINNFTPKTFKKEIYPSIIEESFSLKEKSQYFQIRDHYPSRAGIKEQIYNLNWNKFQKILFDYFSQFEN